MYPRPPAFSFCAAASCYLCTLCTPLKPHRTINKVSQVPGFLTNTTIHSYRTDSVSWVNDLFSASLPSLTYCSPCCCRVGHGPGKGCFKVTAAPTAGPPQVTHSAPLPQHSHFLRTSAIVFLVSLKQWGAQQVSRLLSSPHSLQGPPKIHVILQPSKVPWLQGTLPRDNFKVAQQEGLHSSQYNTFLFITSCWSSPPDRKKIQISCYKSVTICHCRNEEILSLTLKAQQWLQDAVKLIHFMAKLWLV